MSATYECHACSWQGKHHETDASHCPECGGETEDIASIYCQERPKVPGSDANLPEDLPDPMA